MTASFDTKDTLFKHKLKSVIPRRIFLDKAANHLTEDHIQRDSRTPHPQKVTFSRLPTHKTVVGHKKRMVSPSFPSPHLVWSSLRWSACHNSKQASGHMQLSPCSHLIATNASFDAFRGRGASVTTNEKLISLLVLLC